MLFDALCGIVERHPQLFPEDTNLLLRQAHLFRWMGRAHELPLNLTEGPIPGQFGKQFRLAFEQVGLEDKWSCVIVEDKEPGVVGITAERFFIECDSPSIERIMELRPEDQPGAEEMELIRSRPAGTVGIKWGFCSNLRLLDGGEFFVETNLLGYYLGNGHETLFSSLPADDTHLHNLHAEAGRSVHSALREMALFNTPDRLVMKVTKQNGKKHADPYRSPKILRSEFRPYYTLVTVEEGRRLMQLPEEVPERTLPDGTQQVRKRRGHPRILRAACFKKPFTWVRPIWTGPTTAIVGKTRYDILQNV